MAHLSFDERIVISQLLSSGATRAEIARQLGRHPSTITRELQRNRSDLHRYQPIKANQKARVRRSEASRSSKLELPHCYDLVTKKLLEKWSPQQISGWLKRQAGPVQVSHETIYRFLNSLHREHPLRQAMRRQGRRNRKEKPGFIKRPQENRRSIHERPKIVNQRGRVGDWEVDLVRCFQGSGYLITAVERRTGYVLIKKIASKQCARVMNGMISMFATIDRGLVKTITLDNGSEFNYHPMVSKRLKVKFYFADPYNSGQRGTNENTNGLIRQYFPKTLHYGYISQQAVKRAQEALNHRPRLRLGYRTPASLFQ